MTDHEKTISSEQQFALQNRFAAQAQAMINRLCQSKFARDAAWLLVLNLISKAIAFVGSAYAAQCLGPVNLGTSALVQTTAMQVGLLYNGGFNTVTVRRIAGDYACTTSVAATVVTFRIISAAILLLSWLIVVALVVPHPKKYAWMVGGILLITSASGVGFAFQGMEKLPIQNAIATGTSLLTAAAYVILFTPGMFLGADLIVIASAGTASVVASWIMYRRTVGSWPVSKIKWDKLRSLLRESWLYWILSVVVFFYSLFQFPLIAYFLGENKTGIFRSAFLMASGVEMLFSSINVLLLPRMVVWKKQGLHVMWQQQYRLLLIFLLIGVPVTGVMILVAPFAYRVFFGQADVEGIQIFQILVVGRLMVFIVQIYVWGVVAAGKDKKFLFASILGAVSSVTFNILFIPVYGLMGVAVVAVFTEIIIGLSCYFFMRKFMLGCQVT
jgi:O-antigen/teichoic acid export membrane protein